jgi:uncharacterized integral membrane protein
MASLIVVSVLLLAVVMFALQNAQAITIRFLGWQLQSSVAVVAVAATAAGMLIAELFGLARDLLRLKRELARAPSPGRFPSHGAASRRSSALSTTTVHPVSAPSD